MPMQIKETAAPFYNIYLRHTVIYAPEVQVNNGVVLQGIPKGITNKANICSKKCCTEQEICGIM